MAFTEPATLGGARTQFAPSPEITSDAEFRADLRAVRARGQRVLISIGGANGRIELDTAAATETFAASIIEIIGGYSFDGIDVDLEGSSLSLSAGDTDFRAPRSPRIVHFIAALRRILDHAGPGFLLSMAPETAFVQGGHSVYSGADGAYLPVIYTFRDRLSYIHVQHYDTGSMIGLDGVCYGQGAADFHVTMTEMLLAGFTVADTGLRFPPLAQTQVAIGLPAAPGAAGGGYTAPAEIHRALDYLIHGRAFGGRYRLVNPAGYPALRGLMTWSINRDLAAGSGFSRPHRAYLDALAR